MGIKITDNRLMHILRVARKCYSLALERGHTEAYARKMFMVGYLHDVGYEFASKQSEHPSVSAELASLVGCSEDVINLINTHGNFGDFDNEEFIILNTADMLTSYDGSDVSAKDRLIDIENRYGKNSNTYKKAVDICTRLRLI